MHTQLLLIALLVSSCTSSTPANTTTATAEAELPRIALTTEGGISGRGLGDLFIERGRITARDLTRQCTGVLSDAERAALAKLPQLAANDPAGTGRPDQIRYTLTVGDRSQSWHGEEAPPEAAAWYQLLWTIRARVLDAC
jgi:hypothetical protein